MRNDQKSKRHRPGYSFVVYGLILSLGLSPRGLSAGRLKAIHLLHPEDAVGMREDQAVVRKVHPREGAGGHGIVGLVVLLQLLEQIRHLICAGMTRRRWRQHVIWNLCSAES